MKKIRKPAVAGLFYPQNPKKLSDEIETLLSISKTEFNPDRINGIISPHAGYIYSGKTAAFGFSLLKDKDINKVIIISPSHREYFPGVCVYDGDAYETPLGIVEVETDVVEKMTENSRVVYKGIEGHKDEHAVEVQIPFLQKVLNEFKIIPVVMGDQGKMFVDELADKLKYAADEKTLIVSSSDLSHYHSKDEADKLDSVLENNVNEFNFDKLLTDLERGYCEACGGGPIAAMMKAAASMNKNNSLILNRSNSGDTSGDYNSVVGYLSAVVY